MAAKGREVMTMARAAVWWRREAPQEDSAEEWLLRDGCDETGGENVGPGAAEVVRAA